MNVHQSMFCYIYILHIFKHNALGLHLTLYLHLTLSMLNYIHYRTNSKHTFYFNKKTQSKQKNNQNFKFKIQNLFLFFFKIKKNFNFILLYWGNFISRTLPPIYVPFRFQKFSIFLGTLDFAHFTPF